MHYSSSLLLMLILVGCTEAEKESAADALADAVVAHSQEPSADAAGLRGEVLERIDAASYSYLRLSTGSGEIWAAVPKTEIEVGTQVTIANPMPMDGFESKTLGRSFDKLVFGTLAGPAKAGAVSDSLPPGHPPMGGQAAQTQQQTPGSGELEIPKAAGPDGYTIEEIYNQKDKLAGTSVAVRGKVAKFTAGILNRNWLHLRDGTGSPAQQDNDLTVTTQDEAKVGDVVLIKGTVRLDQDFGAGYMYPVLLEDASVE